MFALVTLTGLSAVAVGAGTRMIRDTEIGTRSACLPGWNTDVDLGLGAEETSQRSGKLARRRRRG